MKLENRKIPVVGSVGYWHLNANFARDLQAECGTLPHLNQIIDICLKAGRVTRMQMI